MDCEWSDRSLYWLALAWTKLKAGYCLVSCLVYLVDTISLSLHACPLGSLVLFPEHKNKVWFREVKWTTLSSLTSEPVFFQFSFQCCLWTMITHIRTLMTNIYWASRAMLSKLPALSHLISRCNMLSIPICRR